MQSSTMSTPAAMAAVATPAATAATAHARIQPAQAAEFLAQGCLHLPDVVGDEDFARLSSVYDRCFAPDAATAAGVHNKALGGVDTQGRQALPQVLGPSEQFPELRELALFETFRTIAAAILQAPVVLRSEHMILKPAGYGIATPWHQDQAYHHPALNYRQINFWVPLEDATVESGCLHFVPGSHLGPILPHTYLHGDKNAALVAQDQTYWTRNSRAVPCPRGGCTLHHSYMLHYAGPNTTAHDRRAYILVFGIEPTRRPVPWQFPWNE